MTDPRPDWRPRRLVLPGLVYAAILGLSSLPASTFAPVPWVAALSWVAHAIEYGALGAALWWALPGTLRRPRFLVSVGAVLGASDELWQSTVPGRHSSLADLAVDVVAVGVGAWIAARTTRRR